MLYKHLVLIEAHLNLAVMTTDKKRYSELMSLPTFEDRVNYLKCYSNVGEDTFGYDRYLNQMLYKSAEWKNVRQKVILRDNGRDLGCDGYEIFDKAIIHHINPITPADIINGNPEVFNMDNLITTTLHTHNLIHYGIENNIPKTIIERKENDTCPWKIQENKF